MSGGAIFGIVCFVLFILLLIAGLGFVVHRRRNALAALRTSELSPFSFQNPVYQANQDGGDVKFKDPEYSSSMTSGVPVEAKAMDSDYLRAFVAPSANDTAVLVQHDANDDTNA